MKKRESDTTSAPSASAPATPLGELEVSAAWQRLLASVTPDMRITVSVRRLPSYLTPQVTQPETLPPVAFAPDLEAMQDEVARRYGPGRYKLYIRWIESDGTRNVVTPEFTIGDPGAGGGGVGGPPPNMPEPPLTDADATIEETVSRLARAANLRAKAAELGALGAIAGGEVAAPSAPLTQLSQLAEVLRAIQPDPWQALKAAAEYVRPHTESSVEASVAMLEKISAIAERLGGSPGGPSRTTGWDFALEVLRQIGPVMPSILGPIVAGLLTRPPMEPVGSGIGEAAGRQSETPSVLNVPSGVALPDPLAAWVGGDPVKRSRLEALLRLARAEMDRGCTPESWGAWADAADRYAPGLLDQLMQLGPDRTWMLWADLDRDSAHRPQAVQWVRGLLDWLSHPGGEKEER